MSKYICSPVLESSLRKEAYTENPKKTKPTQNNLTETKPTRKILQKTKPTQKTPTKTKPTQGAAYKNEAYTKKPETWSLTKPRPTKKKNDAPCHSCRNSSQGSPRAEGQAPPAPPPLPPG